MFVNLGSKFSCGNILLKMTDKDFGVKFFISLFLFMSEISQIKMKSV